jgi:hypothetical protein
MAVSERSSPKSKIWMIVVGVVVLAGAAYVATIYPPSGDTLAGSVTPADRYRADIKPTDLTTLPLGDQTVSEFMQTDIFQKIVSDKALAVAFGSDAFRQALGSDAFRQALGSDAFRQALGSDAFRQALGSDAFRQALGGDAFRQSLGSDAFRQAMGSDAFRQAMGSDAFRAALSNDAARAAAQSQ